MGATRDGPFVSVPNRYFNKGPDFYGDEEDIDPSCKAIPGRTNSTQGLYHFQPDGVNDKSLDANIAAAVRTATPTNAIKHGAGIISNQLTKKEWIGSGIENTNRLMFYKATKIIDNYLSKGLVKESALTSVSGRSVLINFITDGALPTRNSKIPELS